MKRFNPFSPLTEALADHASSLAGHPNSFFTEADDMRFVQNALHALHQISERLDTEPSAADRIFHDQLNQLMEEIHPVADSVTAAPKF